MGTSSCTTGGTACYVRGCRLHESAASAGLRWDLFRQTNPSGVVNEIQAWCHLIYCTTSRKFHLSPRWWSLGLLSTNCLGNSDASSLLAVFSQWDFALALLSRCASRTTVTGDRDWRNNDSETGGNWLDFVRWHRNLRAGEKVIPWGDVFLCSENHKPWQNSKTLERHIGAIVWQKLIRNTIAGEAKCAFVTEIRCAALMSSFSKSTSKQSL